jgi:hypothetical protein
MGVPCIGAFGLSAFGFEKAGGIGQCSGMALGAEMDLRASSLRFEREKHNLSHAV